MHTSLTRRELLGSGATLALAAPVSLSAVLQGNLPGPLQALLPQDARGALDLVAELLKLEQEAKLLRLPASKLSFGEGGIPADPGRLYELAMPRLVALVDRAEKVSPAFADKAGSLLARLHRTQYEAGDGWFSDQPQQAAPGIDQFRFYRPPRAATPLLPGEGDEELVLKGRVDLPQASLPDAAQLLPPVNRSFRYDEIASEYAAWFAAATLRPEHQQSADWHVAMMRQSKDRYQAVGKVVGVPWPFIAAIHGLEASFNFRAHLHNGDHPLSQRTRQVPPGRPRVWLPPSDWAASALDAIRLLGFAGQSDWSLPRMLHRLEAYNGFGYRRSGRSSPYLWSFSNLFTSGKFVADGRFDPKAKSQQCGAAVMLKLLDLAGELG
ncbi:MAG: hypothetical protein RL299_896 [Pseudomonadota bacterium]|jgi:lysozyme family protein